MAGPRPQSTRTPPKCATSCQKSAGCEIDHSWRSSYPRNGNPLRELTLAMKRVRLASATRAGEGRHISDIGRQFTGRRGKRLYHVGWTSRHVQMGQHGPPEHHGPWNYVDRWWPIGRRSDGCRWESDTLVATATTGGCLDSKAKGLGGDRIPPRADEAWRFVRRGARVDGKHMCATSLLLPQSCRIL